MLFGFLALEGFGSGLNGGPDALGGINDLRFGKFLQGQVGLPFLVLFEIGFRLTLPLLLLVCFHQRFPVLHLLFPGRRLLLRGRPRPVRSALLLHPCSPGFTDLTTLFDNPAAQFLDELDGVRSQQGEKTQPVDHPEQDDRAQTVEQSLEYHYAQSLSNHSTRPGNQICRLPTRKEAVLHRHQARTTDQADRKSNPGSHAEGRIQKETRHAQPDQSQRKQIGRHPKELNLAEADQAPHRPNPVLPGMICFHPQGEVPQKRPIGERKLDRQIPRGVRNERQEQEHARSCKQDAHPLTRPTRLVGALPLRLVPGSRHKFLHRAAKRIPLHA